MTRIRLSLALVAILLFQAEMAMAATVTLAFEGHFVGLRTDGGATPPADINIGTSFSGTITYDLGAAVNMPLEIVRGSASASALFYGPTAYELAVNVGGYHIQSSRQGAIFLDDALHIETQVPADVIYLSFLNDFYGNYPFGAGHHQVALGFVDTTTSAMDNISLTEPLGADWRIPLELFSDTSFDITVYGEFIEDLESAWPPYRDYYILEGRIDSIREVPLPAAGAMFALALVQLLVLRRRLR